MLVSLIRVPGDASGITGKHDPNENPTQGFLPRASGWYRKHFKLPAEWKGSTVYVYIEGSFHITNSWLNGKHLGEHPAGYTSFWLRLDDVPARCPGLQPRPPAPISVPIHAGVPHSSPG